MSRITHSAFIGVALIVLCSCAAAENGRSATEREAPRNSSNAYRLELTDWQDETMCRALDAAIQKRWDVADGRLCSIPILDAGPEFSLPDWRDVDGQALLPVIRDLALQKDWFGPLKPLTERWEQIQIPQIVPDELIEQVWAPMEADFVVMLASGELRVQAAEFDFANNGEIDTIYRIRGWSLVETNRTDKPFEPEFWEPSDCGPGGIGASYILFKKRTKDYGYSDLADLLLSYAGRRNISSLYYVFQYEGRTFQHWSHSTAITQIPSLPDYCDWRRKIAK